MTPVPLTTGHDQEPLDLAAIRAVVKRFRIGDRADGNVRPPVKSVPPDFYDYVRKSARVPQSP